MEFSSTEKATRAVFDDIQAGHMAQPASLQRFRSLITTAGLGVPDDFFRGKTCADIGCGATVNSAYNLLKLHAGYVHALDLTESFIEPAQHVLAAEPDFDGRWQLDVGSVERLPYADSTFDFIVCHGVIHNVDNDDLALREICRCLKPGGMANLTVLGKGGLLGRLVMELLRDEYRTNPEFAALLDHELTPGYLTEQIDWLKMQVDNDGSESYRFSLQLLDALKGLLDQDWILTLQDRVQTPVYHTYREAEFEAKLRTAGFSAWHRISRQPAYQNVRKIVAPLYLHYQSPLARLFYQDGTLVMVVTK
jgi:ubiquinone/menaquinone biosynthesis C-methylase UbiE